MPVRYKSMFCRECGATIEPKVLDVERAVVTTSFADCNFVCPNVECAIGYSNAQNEAGRVAIYPDYRLNVPSDPPGLRDELPRMLDESINQTNSSNKKQKFAFTTSEDAVTWVTFWYLNNQQQVGSALGAANPKLDDLLLWGTSLTPEYSETRHALLAVLTESFHEDPRRVSEPDAIALTPEELFFVEVKYHSGNDKKKPGTGNWNRYLSHTSHLFSTSCEDVQSAGYYELTRNWVIGNTLAARLSRRFTLVNLGPEKIRTSALDFEQSLATDHAKFRFVDWSAFIEGFSLPLDAWFADYISKKFPTSSR